MTEKSYTKGRIAWKQLWRSEGRQLIDTQQFAFIKLVKLSSFWSPNRVFQFFEVSWAFTCIRFPCPILWPYFQEGGEAAVATTIFALIIGYGLARCVRTKLGTNFKSDLNVQDFCVLAQKHFTSISCKSKHAKSVLFVTYLSCIL